MRHYNLLFEGVFTVVLNSLFAVSTEIAKSLKVKNGYLIQRDQQTFSSLWHISTAEQKYEIKLKERRT